MHLITLMCFRQSRLEEISSVQPCEHNTHRPSDSSLLIHMKFQSRGKSCGLSQSSRRTIASNPESMSRKLTTRHTPEIFVTAQIQCFTEYLSLFSHYICIYYFIFFKRTLSIIKEDTLLWCDSRSSKSGFDQKSTFCPWSEHPLRFRSETFVKLDPPHFHSIV